MRIIPVLLISLATIIITLGGCEKEDSTQNNHMLYNGVEYQLDKGVLQSYGKWDGSDGYGQDLVLLSPGFVIHENGGELDSVSGIGHGIVFDFYSNSIAKLDVGKYTWDENEDGNPFTLVYADAVINWSVETGEGTEIDAIAGEVTVVSNDGEYELIFFLTMEDGSLLSGYYKGSVTQYDESKKSSSSRSFFD